MTAKRRSMARTGATRIGNSSPARAPPIAFSPRSLTKSSARRIYARARNLSRLRLMLDQQVRHAQALIVRLANRLQRRLMAQQTRSWEFDLEEGIARHLAPRAHRRQPIACAVLQARKADGFPRYGGDAFARQFRFDARAADHARRDVAPIFSRARWNAAA